MLKTDTRQRYFIGIDPGQTGAVAVLDSQFSPIIVEDYDRDKCAEILRSLTPSPHTAVTAIIEHVHAMPQNGAVSMFNFGMNFGWWKGLMDALKIAYSLVDPRKWQNHFGLVKTTKTDKPSLPFARKYFPTVDLHLKKHNGRADALCIAAFGIDWYKAFTEAGGNPDNPPLSI